ncbi:MAG TPA: molecular chaperone HtpG [Candidatus Egerieisoma faecipullorum]|uniref:Molecular chaperone HtpG n=1 Tax=Candidatus Egerieisoma faecipullorum TaxID=2840963 RepID=A0A9D1LA14_9CLOT|nr:molecular chaperone HtpG [Candidatus Egerieisoma faecipullorum]
MENMQGSVSISTENIFPIIKKWLYSEKDIFLREVVSNASDAISKLKKLISVGEASVEETEWKIEVSLDKEAGTITIFDNGIGMTQEEVVKYINQIAFSGAKDFLEKYQGKTDDAQIIGHFGLGFYSVFMVSDKVEIDTKSYQEGAEAVHWESVSGMDYAITPSETEKRGTYITLHIAEDSKEYLDAFKLRETLRKYFSFLPINLYFIDVEEEQKKAAEAEKAEQKQDASENEAPKEPEAPKPINTTPLWVKPVKDCTDEEYKEFYRTLFHDYNEPLFWIHLNIDYPFNLKGILYFPKLKSQYDTLEGVIKVYYNQVFVADNVKEILPEFLMLLKGAIDCPDLPLNVSRSFLQNDGYVNKISTHITKKVADKLTGMFNTEKETYCKYWDDINPFVKFGCLKDEKFFDKVKEAIVFKTTDGEYLTLEEMGDQNAIHYIDDTLQQAQYVNMYKDSGVKIAVLDGPLDNHFISFLEYKNPGKVKFVRVDADVTENMKDPSGAYSKEELEQLAELCKEDFVKVSGNEKLTVRAEAIKSPMPAILLLSEEARRMQEMAKMYGSLGFPTENDVTLVLNASNKTVQKLRQIKESGAASEDTELICGQIYDLAKLAHQPMEADAMTRFIERSAKLLDRITE